ncbi:BQ2448_3190 [Microbotryum intermedium]|uniref:BQ2448_3190 protein n=1 Tax=Microbotryum intermedium TaxID=269621 RepID=A0A238FCN5_9BASI|nr:BQ2448_3190 [Microbotryum intermedium]
MSSRPNFFQLFLLVSTAAPLFGMRMLVEANSVVENALRYRQRYNLTDTAANSTLADGANSTIADDSPLAGDSGRVSLSLITIILPTVVACIIGLLFVINPKKARNGAAAERAPSGSPPRYSHGSNSAFRICRPGHDTNGAAIEEGGQRAGSRDEDDAWEDSSRPAAQEEEKEGLPSYAVDIDLPGYAHILRSNARQVDSTFIPVSSETSHLDPSAESHDAEEQLASHADYERASRNNGPRAPEPVVVREMAQVRRQTAMQSPALEHASLR